MSSCEGVYKLLPIVAAGIVVYFFILRAHFGINNPAEIPQNDFMNRIVFESQFIKDLFGEACCSMWPISHFFLFFIAGLMFPECDVQVLGLGILWELFEVGFSVYEGTGDKYQPVVRYSNGEREVEYAKSWWMGSYKDIFFNFLGYYTAKLLLYLTGRKSDAPKWK